MFLCCWLVLGALIPLTLSTDPGVKVKLTAKGLEYGRQLGMVSIQEKLKTIQVPDFSGNQRVTPIGKVKYSLTNLKIVDVGLPTSSVALVPGTGVRLSIGKAFIQRRNNSGSFDLSVSDLTVGTSIAVESDETGRPAVNTVDCAATVGSANIKFHGGASWLYNLFRKFIDKAIRRALERQICPLVTNAISDLNPQLKTLNVLAKVDKHAEIEYSMVSSPAVTASSLELGLKGEFYNIGKKQEPPFSAAAFNLPPQADSMLYIGLSAFTANSAAFVYSAAGALSLYVTDDMVPPASPFRLNTNTFGVFIPQIAQRFLGLTMKLLVKTVKPPVVTFEPNNTMVKASGTVTAYAIHPNSTLSPLFVLNLVDFFRLLFVHCNYTQAVLRIRISCFYYFVSVNLFNYYLFMLKFCSVVQLAKGYPLPAIGKMQLVNTQLQVLKDYMLIGTDVQFNSIHGASRG
uniref:Bactericidal permeability-increasing protein n=1 Tax=Gasterosteus aculeatus aculeatus TaxID=481459 RepID=A0AAQ4NTF9_GASAC